MVYRVADQFAGNHYDAEDIAQEVFIKVYRSLDRFRQDAQLSSWIYRIVMNACIDHRRRHRPSGAAPFGEEAEHRLMNTVEETPGPEDRAYAGELGQVLEAENQPAAARAADSLRDAPSSGVEARRDRRSPGPRGRNGQAPAARRGPSAAPRTEPRQRLGGRSGMSRHCRRAARSKLDSWARCRWRASRDPGAHRRLRRVSRRARRSVRHPRRAGGPARRRHAAGWRLVGLHGPPQHPDRPGTDRPRARPRRRESSRSRGAAASRRISRRPPCWRSSPFLRW